MAEERSTRIPPALPADYGLASAEEIAEDVDRQLDHWAAIPLRRRALGVGISVLLIGLLASGGLVFHGQVAIGCILVAATYFAMLVLIAVPVLAPRRARPWSLRLVRVLTWTRKPDPGEQNWRNF